MSFMLPSADQVRHLGESLGMEITPDYANSFINYIRPFADGYRVLASLPDDVPAVKYPRGAYFRPEGDENKYGAWIAKTDIKGASSGKLAGKKVAVKDTYAVAGVPLTNGASVLEFRAGIRRAYRDAAARRRCGNRRQIGLRIFLLLWRCGNEHIRAGTQSESAGLHAGWIVERLGCLGRGRRGRHGDRRRSGRLHPSSRLPIGRRRYKADLGLGALYRHHGHRTDDRPCRTAHSDDRRERSFSGSDGRL
jgi:hypothetical protein